MIVQRENLFLYKKSKKYVDPRSPKIGVGEIAATKKTRNGRSVVWLGVRSQTGEAEVMERSRALSTQRKETSQIAGLLYGRSAKLRNCQMGLPDCRTSDCHIARVLDCRTANLSDCQIDRWPKCKIAPSLALRREFSYAKNSRSSIAPAPSSRLNNRPALRQHLNDATYRKVGGKIQKKSNHVISCKCGSNQQLTFFPLKPGKSKYDRRRRWD